MKTYTRSEFLSVIEAMMAEFEQDHEEHTGYDDQHRMSLIRWWEEIRNLIENSS